MPKRTDLESILILGSGPIIIGQACEFDYSGTQACQALKEEGYRVILVNSNPATIMTDPDLADATYIEPLVPEMVERIIAKERPSALLPTMGGQTSLNLAKDLGEAGVLDKYDVELIGANLEAIERAENRERFQEIVLDLGLDVPRGKMCHSKEEARTIAEDVGFPLILRSAYTLGGSGGSIVYNVEELEQLVALGLEASPINQVLVEESIFGWKEFELEVMRDIRDNVVIVCSIENVDPMGVHTGDSLTVAPSQTLSDKEYQRMRDAAIRIIRAIGVETGGSNIQFAVSPTSNRMVVIEMNPRVSRSSALASKATGFPIARVAARLAVGYTLDEVQNEITAKTPACFEPTIDYVVVKAPRFDFEKFTGSPDQLGVRMQSVGEAMAFGRTFPEALQKALRSLENGWSGLETPPEIRAQLKSEASRAELRRKLRKKLLMPSSKTVFYLKWAFEAGLTEEEVGRLTRWDPWFLYQIRRIIEAESRLRNRQAGDLEPREWKKAKQLGFSDDQLSHFLGESPTRTRERRKAAGVEPTFKVVDTCAAEFEAETPYLYSTYETEQENVPSDRRKVMILGGGPNRIGQGIEFDYCCVRGVYALQEEGFEVVLVNCNPETVSTDYDTTDKLFFEPLTLEHVLDIVEQEQPEGVIVQFGGQTPLKLALALERAGVPILGTAPEKIDLAEDRSRFSALVEELGLEIPPYGTATSRDEALEVAGRIGYPLLVRPSYVLGGRSMRIVYDDESLLHYLARASDVSSEHPILLDRFLEDAFEFDVDALCDGEEVFIAGVMQHIEEAGVHSGDSACVLPPYLLSQGMAEEIREVTEKLALALEVEGLMNVQYAVLDEKLYLLEANPRASRTVPFVSKATGLKLADLAAKVMVGRKISDLLADTEPTRGWIAVKEAVIPFDRFPNTPIFLGPEMRSTGEVMALSRTFGKAFAKTQISVSSLPTEGAVLITVNDNDKLNVIPIARDFQELGFDLIATSGTAKALQANGIQVRTVYKVDEGRPHVVDLMKNGEVSLLINTPLGKESRFDEHAIGRQALRQGVPLLTTLSGAHAAVRGILAARSSQLEAHSLQEIHARKSEAPVA